MYLCTINNEPPEGTNKIKIMKASESKIKENKNWSIPVKYWEKVEALPVSLSGDGWRDHRHPDGRTFRVTFQTWVAPQYVNRIV